MEENSTRLIVEVVAFGYNRAAHMESFVRSLHEYLCAHLPAVWQLAVADNGSSDESWPLAQSITHALPRTSAVRIRQRLGRKEIRFGWSQSKALVVAFIEVKPDTDFEKMLAPLIRDATRRVEPGQATELESTAEHGLTRRSALVAIGSIGLSAFLAACAQAAGNGTTSTTVSPGTTSGSSTSAGATATTPVGATTTIDCLLLPEMTEGPYYLDLDLVRSDLTEDRVGAPLALTIVVADSNSCSPIQDAAVDLWHCDAEGIYSGFIAASTGQGSGTDDTVFLRGTQITDASGAATFQTLYPGWYQGRTVHMHMKGHVGGNQIHTTQLFFDDAFTDQVYAANEPYASRNDRDMLNSEDGIYSGGGDATTLNVTESGDGYAAALTVGVQI
jgi:protocatechuate 3,4-dioxygenase beta subunit